MAGEIAAVHRRDVERRQRLQRLRVVPVVEMSAVALQRCIVCRVLAVRSISCRRRYSRNRRPPDWPATPGPCWSARCGGRRRRPGTPDSCRAAASGLPADEVSKKPRSGARACAGTASARRVSVAWRRASGRLIHQAMAGRQAREPGPARPRQRRRCVAARECVAVAAMAGAIHIALKVWRRSTNPPVPGCGRACRRIRVPAR